MPVAVPVVEDLASVVSVTDYAARQRWSQLTEPLLGESVRLVVSFGGTLVLLGPVGPKQQLRIETVRWRLPSGPSGIPGAAWSSLTIWISSSAWPLPSPTSVASSENSLTGLRYRGGAGSMMRRSSPSNRGGSAMS